MVDVSQISASQEYIIARHSRLVGRVLDLVEASLPEGNEMIRFESEGIPKS